MKEKDKGGRPTDYKDEYVNQAKVACMRGGFSQNNLAELFGVRSSTIKNWKKKHLDFKEACVNGKGFFKTKASLFKRSHGFYYEETMTETFVGKGKKEKKIKKYMPPDTTAAIFIMTNMDKGQWKSKQNLELTEPDGGAVTIKVITGVERGPGDNE